MADKYTIAARRNAAQTMSSVVDVFTRQTDGTVDSERAWLTLRERIARSLVSMPDTAFYLRYLCSNKALQIVKETVRVLDAMITAAEGTLYSQAVVVGTSAAAKGLATGLLTSLTAGTSPSAMSIQRTTTETRVYAARTLLPNMRSGSRLQIKGVDAARSYGVAKQELLVLWPKLLQILTLCARSHLFSADAARTDALRSPTANLLAQLSAQTSTASASDQMLQLSAGISSLTALGRELDPLLRLRVEGTDSFPVEIQVTELTQTSGFVTALTILCGTKKQDPRLLSIAAGDVVRWNGYTAVVADVSSTDVTLTDSTIPTGTSGIVEILPRFRTAFEELCAGLQVLLQNLPTETSLVASLQRLEGTSAGEVRDRCVFLGNIRYGLEEPSTELLKVFERLEGQVATPELVGSITLRAYAPTFSSSIKETGRAILDQLRFGGYDRAETLLLTGDIDAVLVAPADEASYLQRVVKLAVPFAPNNPGR